MKDGEDMAEQHQAQDQHEQTAEELHELKRIRREKLAELQAAGKDPFQQVRFERDHYTTDIHEHFDELEGKTVRLAGRMMSKRIMGKASFSDMRDRYGRLQLYIKRDNVGEDVYKGYKKFDIGDIIGIEGEVFRTQKGEISVSVTELTLLSKNLAPLPEKWHGLKDTDMRYRQRYVDLIVNPEVRDTFEKRSAIVREIRNFMDSRGFMEVETPCLNTIPGGAAARPFITHHNALDIDMYLRIATELHLKRLIVGGLERVYEIGRIFRNEGMDTRHNPEFTTIELYQAYTDYHGMMDITEDMVIHVCEKVLGSTKVMYQGVEIDFSKGWKRMTMAEAVKEYAGIDFMALSPEEALEAVKAKGLEIEKGKESWGDLMSTVLRRVRRGKPHAADLYHRLSGRDLSAGKAQAVRSASDRALRVLYLRPRAVQRILRAERPDRPEGALRASGCSARRRRRGSRHDGRGFHQCAGIRYASHGRHGHGHRPSGHVPDRRGIHPRRAAVPDNEDP